MNANMVNPIALSHCPSIQHIHLKKNLSRKSPTLNQNTLLWMPGHLGKDYTDWLHFKLLISIFKQMFNNVLYLSLLFLFFSFLPACLPLPPSFHSTVSSYFPLSLPLFIIISKHYLYSPKTLL